MPGTAHVTVLGEDGETNVAQPISDAYVIAIEMDGTTTTVRTDATGKADIDVFGNTAIHIARPMMSGDWALSSFRAINDGANIVVGGEKPLGTSTARQLIVNLPAFPSVDYDQAWVTGPRRCLAETAWNMSTSVDVLYDPQCEGESVELFALAFDIYIPLGTITLTDGATVDRTTSSWQDLEKVGIDYSNVPADVTDTYAFLAWPTGTQDLVPMSESSDTPDTDHFVGLHFDIPPIVAGTTMIHVFESANGARAVYERIDSWPGTRQFDASMLPTPPPTPMINIGASQVQWTGAAPPDTDVYWSSTDIDLGAKVLHWNAYGPAGATQVTFPDLPAELSAITPTGSSGWGTPRIVFAGMSDFTYESSLAFVDRDIYWWWSEGAYMPPGTLSLTATATAP